jgi:hypothetical protein
MLLALCIALAVTAPNAAPVFPRPAHVVTIEHLPPDSLDRTELLDGFHAAAAETSLWCLATGAGEPRRHAFENRFAVVDGDPGENLWSVEVTLGLPPPRRLAKTEHRRNPQTGQLETRTIEKSDLKHRAARGMTVVVAIVPPGMHPDDPRPAPVRGQFLLPLADGETGNSTDVLTRGYLLSWTEAGRAAGRFVLEALHRQSGDLPDSLSLDLAPTLRFDAAR